MLRDREITHSPQHTPCIADEEKTHRRTSFVSSPIFVAFWGNRTRARTTQTSAGSLGQLTSFFMIVAQSLPRPTSRFQSVGVGQQPSAHPSRVRE